MFLKRSVKRSDKKGEGQFGKFEISLCLKTFFSGLKRINRSNKSCFQCKATEKEPSKGAFD